MLAPAPLGPEWLRQVLGGRIAGNLLNSQYGRNESDQRYWTLLTHVTEILRYRYGSLGARWWLEQPTPNLEGRAPVELLTDGDCADARRVSALASAAS